MKKLITTATSVLGILLTSGCATHQDVINNGPFRTFQSTQTAAKVAVCVSRNSDDYFRDSMLTKVVYTGQEPIEVELRNGGSQYAKILVLSTATGSKADFLFSNFAKFNFPETTLDILTKGCL